MWSLGCIVAEMYTGAPLFPAIDENELIEFYELVLGNVPQKIIAQSDRRREYFTVQDGKFVTKKSPKSRVHLVNPNTVSLIKNLFLSKKNMPSNLTDSQIMEHKTVNWHEVAMAKFIRRCLEYDPSMRIKPEEALEDPFI